MNKTKIYTVIILFAFACMLSVACTQTRTPCLTPTTAGLNIVCVHFPIDTSTVPIDTALPGAIFFAMTSSGNREVIDTLYNSLFTISLSPVDSICRYMIATDSLSSSLYDTVSFYYQRNLQFISNACGYAYFYTLDSVKTSHFNIDSITITNPNVTNNVNATANIQIYIHPDY